MRQRADVLYGIAVSGILAVTSAAAALLAASGGATPTWQAVVGVGALSLGAWYAGHVARPFVTRLVRPTAARLPRVAIHATVPDAWRTLIVLPAIVATPERARELLARLGWLAREHGDPNLRFALLADFADAPTSTTSADDEIVREEHRFVERINAELRDQYGDKVFVLHRQRSWHAADRMWMGWERKRGKLLELHRLLLGRPKTSYRWMFGDLARQIAAAEFPYVFTVDEGNWLTRGEVLSVLHVAAHPTNRAHFDPDTGRLVHGYAIFQPAVVHGIPSPHANDVEETGAPRAASQHSVATRFHFDVLGVGIFQGKGLLDVRACHALLDDVLPPGVVLHHDLPEGFIARTAEVHDAFVLESLAPGYLAQIQRGHRWLRGYFQLLPWILPRVRGCDGTPRANPLCSIHRLFILELVLTELARPASLVLLIAGWLTLRTHVVVWTVLVCPPLALLLVRLMTAALSAIQGAVRRTFRRSARVGRRAGTPQSWLVNAFATLFSQAVLPYEAVVVVDAFCRASWRMVVSRRHLLEWTPVSRVRSGAPPRKQHEYRRVLWICYATGLLTLASVAAIRPVRLLIAVPFATAWICAPLLAAWLDRALITSERQPAEDPTNPHRSALGPELGGASAAGAQ